MWTKPVAETLRERDRQVFLIRWIEAVIPHEHVQALDLQLRAGLPQWFPRAGEGDVEGHLLAALTQPGNESLTRH